MSTLFPDSIHNYYRQEVECGKASTLIKKYLKIFNTSEIEYIKIDIEGADKLVLNDLIKNDILAKNLSVECNDPEVIEFLLKSKYKFFKLVKGADSFFKENVEIITKDKKKNL